MAQERLWNIGRERLLDDGGAFHKEDRNCGNTKLRMKRISSLLRGDVEERKAEMERRNEEAKQEENTQV